MQSIFDTILMKKYSVAVIWPDLTGLYILAVSLSYHLEKSFHVESAVLIR